MNRKILLLLFCCCVMPRSFLLSQAPLHYFLPYERIHKSEDWSKKHFALEVLFEDGTTSHSRNFSEDHVPLFQMYNTTQSSLAMLKGAPVGSDAYQLAQSLQGLDDGVRGHFLVDGTFDRTDIIVAARYKAPFSLFSGIFEVGFFAPLILSTVSDVTWIDQTESVTVDDFDVQQSLTDDIDAITQDLGDLELRGGDNDGLGDCSLVFRWYKDFGQEKKKSLQNVRITFFAGVSFPTAEEKDEDDILSFPLGNDGAWGLPLGAHLDLDFSKYLRSGVEVHYLGLFDNKRVRRLKTDNDQTDLLLLHKGEATRSYGPRWKFTFYLQLQQFIPGFSLMAAYQFLKADQDTLYPQTHDFVHSIVNTAQNLKEWNLHTSLFQINFDTSVFKAMRWFKPRFSLFAKLPFMGRRSIMADTFGGQLSLAF